MIDPFVDHGSGIPLVSVLVSAYDGDVHLLPRAIASIGKQDMPLSLIEVLIAYDGPPGDDAGPIFEKLEAEKYPFGIQAYWPEEATGYYCVPRNQVLPRAMGAYITFLDADNEWSPEHLSGLLKAMRVPDPMGGWPHLAYTGINYVKDREDLDVVVGKSELVPWTPEAVLRLKKPGTNFIDTSCFMVGKALLYRLSQEDGHVFNPELRRFGDWELLARIARWRGVKGQCVPQHSLIYHWTGNNVQLTRSPGGDTEVSFIPEDIYNKLKSEGKIHV